MEFQPKVTEETLLARIRWSGRPVSRSIDTGPGWYQLIWDLVSDLDKLPCGYKVDQVKEKFGTLCFYFTPEHTVSCPTGFKCLLHNRVSGAEYASAVTCELCGEEGEIRSHGWVRCLCDVCDSTYHSERDDDETDC